MVCIKVRQRRGGARQPTGELKEFAVFVQAILARPADREQDWSCLGRLGQEVVDMGRKGNHILCVQSGFVKRMDREAASEGEEQ